MFRGFDTAIEREETGKACKGGCPLFPQLGPEKFVAWATESFCGNRGSPCTPCPLHTFAVAKSRTTGRGAEAGAEHNPSPHESSHPNQPRPRTGGQTSTQPSPTHRPSGHVIKSTPVWRAGDRSPPKRSGVGAIPSPARSRGDVGSRQSPRWSVSGGARRDRSAVAGMR